ncbi:hypothetical protein [uncultured Parvibaculum sp.]|jgi:hypothetical protein
MLHYVFGLLSGFLICAWGVDIGPYDALAQLGHTILRLLSLE